MTTSSPTAPAPWTPPTSLAPRFEHGGLVLRLYDDADAPALFEAVNSSREALLPWLPWAKREHLTPEASLASIAQFRRSAAQPLLPEHNDILGYVMGVFDARDGRLLAGTGFNRICPQTHNAETGYWVRADRRRERVATRALEAVLSWGFTPQSQGGFGFRRVHIFAAALNAASCGVPAKLGLRQVMHTRSDRWVQGMGWSDTLGWDVLADEWSARRG